MDKDDVKILLYIVGVVIGLVALGVILKLLALAVWLLAPIWIPCLLILVVYIFWKAYE